MGINPDKFLNNPRDVAKADEIITRLPRNDMLIHCIVCKEIVKRWRDANEPIKKYGWELMEDVINRMIDGAGMFFGPGDVCRVEKERIVHVHSGNYIDYRGIKRDGGDASYWTGRTRAYIYGGLLLENVVQWLETIVMNEDEIEVLDAGYKLAMQTHDELVAVTPDAQGRGVLALHGEDNEARASVGTTATAVGRGWHGQNVCGRETKMNKLARTPVLVRIDCKEMLIHRYAGRQRTHQARIDSADFDLSDVIEEFRREPDISFVVADTN
jgi:hypothetical protein